MRTRRDPPQDRQGMRDHLPSVPTARESHTPCNRCVRFATTVASGHATLATKQDATLYLGRTFTGWIAPACGWRTHSITSSARNRTDCGTVRPSAFAVLRLMTRSNLVGCSTGISPALAP